MSTENMNATTPSIPKWDEAIINLNEAIRVKSDDQQKLLETCQQAIKTENDSRISARIDSLLKVAEQDKNEFWTQYVDQPTVEILRMVQDAKTKEWSTQKASKYLSFGRIESVYRKQDDKNVTLAEHPRVYRMIAYYVDNLGKIIANDMSSEDKGAKKVIAPTFNYNPKAKDKERVTSPEDRKELDFSGLSIGAMTVQLNYIAKAMFPESYYVPLRKADFRTLKQFATGNKLRNAKLGNEAAFLENFFETVRLRKNGLEYTLTSGATCHRTKTEDSANKH